MNLAIGATQSLTALAKSAAGIDLAGRTMAWSSSDATVATVSSSGLVTAVSKGTAMIIGTSEGITGAVMVTVADPVATLALDTTAITIIRNAVAQLNAIPKDSSGTALPARTVTWSSSNTSVATVSSAGLVTGLSAGTTTITATSESKAASVTVNVSNDQIAAATIVAGDAFSCALTVGGVAYCWGWWEWLGGASVPNYATNVPQAVLGGHTFVALAAGQQHVLGLATDGKIWAWGDNYYGQLGDGTTTKRSTPVLVNSNLTFKAISAGYLTSFALATNGKAYGWGSNSSGQIGDGTNLARYVPTATNTSVLFDKISGGREHTLALTAAGVAYAWGYGSSGELGNNTQISSLSPVVVSGGLAFKQVVAANYASFGLTTGGLAYAWGNNAYAQLGTGDSTTNMYKVPTPVAGGRTYSLLAGSLAGYRAFGVTADGSAYGWGSAYNSSAGFTNIGALGIGGTSAAGGSSKVPVLLSGSTKYSAIAAAQWHTVAVSIAGEAWGWGDGNGSRTGVAYASIDLVPTMSTGATYSLAISPASLSIEAGKTKTFTITMTPVPGGFTTTGLKRFNDTVTVSSLGSIVGQLSSTKLTPDHPVATLTVTAPNTSGNHSIVIGSTSPGLPSMSAPAAQATVTVTPPVTGGALNLVCPTGETALPAGYHCMTNSAGAHVPGKYAHTAMQGSWVDEDAGVCLTWGADGKMSGKYKGGSFGATSTIPQGEWGVIVKHTGVPEGTATQWYVFSETADDQLKLLGYDSASNAIINWGFVKKSSCPSW